MSKQFFVIFDNCDLDSFKLKHIQYNIRKRLDDLKYITYRRIDIRFIDESNGNSLISFEDNRRVEIRYKVNKMLTLDLVDKENIVELYKNTIDALGVIWGKNNWDKTDLERLLIDIKAENYLSCGIYGKTKISPDKNYKADFFVEIFPEYANYFVEFKGKGKTVILKVMFLKGFTDPALFFGFFNNAYWRDNKYFFLKDINNEITYIFNTNNDDYSIEYKPTINSLEQLHNYVKAFQFDTTRIEMHKFLGIPV